MPVDLVDECVDKLPVKNTFFTFSLNINYKADGFSEGLINFILSTNLLVLTSSLISTDRSFLVRVFVIHRTHHLR